MMDASEIPNGQDGTNGRLGNLRGKQRGISRLFRGGGSIFADTKLLFARSVKPVGSNAQPNNGDGEDASKKHQPKRILRNGGLGCIFPFMIGLVIGTVLFGIGMLYVRWRMKRL